MRSDEKVFVVGLNKTGTTSLAAAFRLLGLQVGAQHVAEMFLPKWITGDFAPIVEYCRSADAFQDVPFSLPRTYEFLDRAFPDAKFVLSRRPSAEVWYRSLVRFHSLLVSHGQLPTIADLKSYPYGYPGYIWEAQQAAFGVDEGQLYDRERYIAAYDRHNASVRRYFFSRPDKLLDLDISSPHAASVLSNFLGRPGELKSIPHLNRTA